jgi:TolB-like protein
MSPRLRFGEVEIDLGAFELRRGGTRQAVEPQVFELIGYLARNPGRLITKDELIEAIWKGRIVSDSALTSRIKSARRAIGDDGRGQRWIKTVHGRGVRFVGTVAEQAAPAVTPPAPESGPPAIAVLPFHMLGGAGSGDNVFADGVAEELAAVLSRMRTLTVIARSSTERYRASPADPAQVGRELGARYLVQGSVRRQADAVRINVALVDAAGGTQIWSARYDGAVADLFALEDSITAQLVAAIAPTIRTAEIERARRKRPDSLEAYDCAMRALPLLWAQTREATLEALRLAQRAVELDPAYALGHTYAAVAWFSLFVNSWSPEPERVRVEGLRCARAALQLDKNDPDVLATAGAAEANLGRNLDLALALVEQALTVNPNSVWAWIRGGYCHVYRGHSVDALRHFERAERLSPFDPLSFNREVGIALAHFIAERYEQAIDRAGRALVERPHLIPAHVVIAAAHAQHGGQAQAEAIAARIRAESPAITIARVLAAIPFEPPALRARFIDGLRRAGLSEGECLEQA